MKKAFSRAPPNPLVHSKTTISRLARLNNKIVRFFRIIVSSIAKLEVGWLKTRRSVDILSGPNSHAVPTDISLNITSQKTLTFVAFSTAGKSTVPPFITGGSVENPVTRYDLKLAENNTGSINHGHLKITSILSLAAQMGGAGIEGVVLNQGSLSEAIVKRVI